MRFLFVMALYLLLLSALPCYAADTRHPAEVTVEYGIVFVPEGCMVGPRTYAVIDRLCGNNLPCYAAKLHTICEVTAEVGK